MLFLSRFLFLLFLFPSFSLNLHWTAFFTMHMQTGHSSSRRIASLLAFVSNRSGAQPAAKKKRRSHKKRDVRLVHHLPLFFPPSLGFRFHTYLQHSLATTPISCTPPRHPRHRSFLSFIHRDFLNDRCLLTKISTHEKAPNHSKRRVSGLEPETKSIFQALHGAVAVRVLISSTSQSPFLRLTTLPVGARALVNPPKPPFGALQAAQSRMAAEKI